MRNHQTKELNGSTTDLMRVDFPGVNYQVSISEASIVVEYLYKEIIDKQGNHDELTLIDILAVAARGSEYYTDTLDTWSFLSSYFDNIQVKTSNPPLDRALSINAPFLHSLSLLFSSHKVLYRKRTRLRT